MYYLIVSVIVAFGGLALSARGPTNSMIAKYPQFPRLTALDKSRLQPLLM